MKLSLLTCTSDRPAAFALCLLYAGKQTVKPHEHIIIDDGVVSVETIGEGVRYFYKPEFRGKGSMAKKVKWALENDIITGDALVVWEDDDWVGPRWLETVAKSLTHFDLIGEGNNLYYNVAYRWWFQHGNLTHASLCATALTRAAFPALLKEVSNNDDPFIDSRLWKNYRGKKRVIDPVRAGARHTVGIKAMPGTRGYGSGHDRDSGWAIRDPKLIKLRQLIGADADNYAKFYDEPQAPKGIMQSPDIPKIEVHLVCYNEELILPYALRHYKTFASRIIVHDGGSTDRSKQICEEFGVEVQHWETKGQINDELLRILKETCWLKTDAQWVIMADADELVYFPDGVVNTLTQHTKLRTPVVKCRGFEMESSTLPTTEGQIYEEINHGSPDDRWYGKPCLIQRKLVRSIHFTHGAHECDAELMNRTRFRPRTPHMPPVFLLHYKHIGSIERIGERYDGNKSRFSEVNKKHGFGWQGDGLVHAKQKRDFILKHRKKVV